MRKVSIALDIAPKRFSRWPKWPRVRCLRRERIMLLAMSGRRSASIANRSAITGVSGRTTGRPQQCGSRRDSQQLSYIGDHLVNDADRESYDLWVRQLLAPVAQDVGWEAKPGESEDQAGLRGELMAALGNVARDPQVQALAQKLANQYLADPSSVDHEMASVALRIAARNGDQALYDKITANLKAAKTPEAYFTDIFALGRFSDPKLVEKTLEFAISPQCARRMLLT